MRFFISSELKRNDFLKIIVFFTLLFFLFLWITNVLLYMQIGFNYNSIVEFYLGNEETFRPPKSYIGLLEEAHFHFFTMAILLVTLTHLILFTSISSGFKLALILISFISTFTEIISGWLIRYVSPVFAYLKLSSFYIMQISLLLMMVIIVIYLFKKDD
ncbi:MAG: hypothetical protein ACR2NW_01860 [Thermodesulfobacteriota bacterium]